MGAREHKAKLASSVLRGLVLVTVYISLNSSLNLLNKWSLGIHGFKFPLLLTTAHMLFSFCVLSPAALRHPWPVHRRTLERQWRGLAWIGLSMALNITLNNISLVGISLTLNQIIRSSTPVVTCLVGVVLDGRRPGLQELSSLTVLSAGVMLAVWQGSVSGSPAAAAACVASVGCCGVMMSLTGRLLGEQLGVVRLAFYTAPVSLIGLLPAALYFERDAFADYLPAHYNSAALIILFTSVNAVCYNMVHSKMIKEMSAVSTTVLGEIKIVGLLVLSAMLLGEGKEFTLKMSVGCCLALLGFAMYSQTRIQAIKEELKARLEPSIISLSTEGSPTLGQLAAKGGVLRPAALGSRRQHVLTIHGAKP